MKIRSKIIKNVRIFADFWFPDKNTWFHPEITPLNSAQSRVTTRFRPVFPAQMYCFPEFTGLKKDHPGFTLYPFTPSYTLTPFPWESFYRKCS